MINFIVNNTTLFVLSISLLLIFVITCRTYFMKNKNKLHKYFILLNVTLAIHVLGLILQIIFKNSNIPSIYFDYITYLGGAFTPIAFLFIALAYADKQNIINKISKFIFCIPIVFLMFLWTNDFHHLFYKTYSINLSKTVYGPILIAYAIYSYGLFLTSVVILIKSTVKKSGFFSLQMLLILIGVSVPTFGNLIGFLKIVETTVYAMPILFIVTSVACSVAILKLNAFNIVPVAFRTVMDTMSDAYVVISNDGTIADSNKTFREKFGSAFEIKEKQSNLFDVFDKSNLVDLNQLKKHIKNTRKEGKIITQEYHFQNNVLDRYFEVDIHPISSKSDKNDYIATLLLFKDITQHKLDIQEIEEKQDIIVKQQQLVSIGELAGGVAHDINTPISAIKTGITMLSMKSDRPQEEKDTLQRMDNCATKIINIVNSMRNQIRNLGTDTKIKFKISSVINDIKVITYHELMKNHTEININIEDDVEIEGDPTKLGQVLTNLIVNASQAYGEKEGKIDIIVRKTLKHATITVIDYAGGMDDSIKPYIFKNILTTKGTAGTGLGLYLAYSVIKGNFNGEIDFDSKKGEGTSFHIRIPLVENNDVENKNN